MTIHFDNVSVKYPYEQYATVEQFELTIDGKVSTLLIDIQSGKTTLAKLLMGFVNATSGAVHIEGVDVKDIAPDDKQCAYVAYPPILFENKSVAYNIAYPLKVRGVNKSARQKVACECAQKYGLAHLLDTKVKRLDDDTKMLVAIARLAVRPLKLIILDDCMDKMSKDNLHLLNKIWQDNDATVINLTSDINCAIGDIYLIQHSQLITKGNLQQVQTAKQQLLWLYDHNLNNDEVKDYE